MSVDRHRGTGVVGDPSEPVPMALAVTIGVAIVVEEKSLRVAVTVRKVENDPVWGVFDRPRGDDFPRRRGQLTLWDPCPGAHQQRQAV